jgi:hypothetical protein
VGQEQLADDIAYGLVGLLFIGSIIFGSREGIRITAPFWPHAKLVWNLGAIGFISMAIFLVDLPIVFAWIEPLATFGATLEIWMIWASVRGSQLGLILGLVSVCWLGFMP